MDSPSKPSPICARPMDGPKLSQCLSAEKNTGIMRWDTRNREENSAPEGFREEVAFELGLNARVGFLTFGDCRKRHSLLGKGKEGMLPLFPYPPPNKTTPFF